MSNRKLSSVNLTFAGTISEETHVNSIKSNIEDVIETIARAICDYKKTTVDEVTAYLASDKQDYSTYCLRSDFGSAGNCNANMPFDKFLARIKNKISKISNLPAGYDGIINANLTDPLSSAFLNNTELSNAKDIIANLAGKIGDAKAAPGPTSSGAILGKFNTTNNYTSAASSNDNVNAITNLITVTEIADANALSMAKDVAKALVEELELIKKQKNENKQIFNPDRIKTLVEQIQQDNLFINSCKFKKRVVLDSDIIGRVRLSDIGYWPRLSRYYRVRNNRDRGSVARGTFSLRGNSGGGLIEDILSNGDKKSKELILSDNADGLGIYVDSNNKVKPIKYIDFDDFIDGYEEYHQKNNVGNINIKVCKLNNNSHKMECKSLNKKIDNADFHDDSNSDSEYNINTHGINEEYEDAYKILQIFRASKTITDVLDNLDSMLQYLKYYVLPIKTLEKAKKIHKNIKNNRD